MIPPTSAYHFGDSFYHSIVNLGTVRMWIVGFSTVYSTLTMLNPSFLPKTSPKVSSGKLTYGKSPFLMGKSTINCQFQSQTVSLPERVPGSKMFRVPVEACSAGLKLSALERLARAQPLSREMPKCRSVVKRQCGVYGGSINRGTPIAG